MKILSMIISLVFSLNLLASDNIPIGNSFIFPNDVFPEANNSHVDQEPDDRDAEEPAPSGQFKRNCQNAIPSLSSRSGMNLEDHFFTHIKTIDESGTTNTNHDGSGRRAVFSCAFVMKPNSDKIFDNIFVAKKHWYAAEKYAQELYKDPAVIAVVVHRVTGGLVGMFAREYMYVIKMK